MRVSLEPLWTDVDAQVDALVTGAAGVDVTALEQLRERLEQLQRWGSEDETTGRPVPRTGRPRWAVDGATALNLHGLAAPADVLALVLQFDDAARAWLTGGLTRGTAAGDVLGWWTCSLEEARWATRELVVGRHGMLRLRLVEQLPQALQVRVPGASTLVPVVTVDEVERTNPELAAVLARLRARRRTTLGDVA